ncbi:MAG: phenylacetaldoxime dehydratase family protein [Rubrivivax sp.]
MPTSDARAPTARTLPKRMPPDWTPLVDGYSAGFESHVAEFVIAAFGQQYAAPAPGHGFAAAAARAFDLPDGPASVQHGHFLDAQGIDHRMAIAYWTDPAAFGRWDAADDWPAWCGRPRGAGVWREVLRVPVERGETLLSSPLIRWGLAGARTRLVGPVREHGYWGAMRDRLPVSAHEALEPGASPSTSSAPRDPRQRRIVEPPTNLCVICSGQDWSACEPAHVQFYLRELEPKLRAAMTDLATRAADHGCLGSRFVRMTDAAGQPLDASFAMAYFRSLADLERWAANDPLHLDIYRSFIDHKRRTQTTLRLWHEVLVLPAHEQRFEYLGCPPGTGLAAASGAPAPKTAP